MSNLLHEIKLGMEGRKIGLSTGSLELDRITLGIRKGSNGAIAAAEKAGKSKFLRYHYIVQPYVSAVLTEKKMLRWLLFSLEEPRYKVEADICSALIYIFHGLRISRSLMLGDARNEDGHPVLMTPSQEKLVVDCYHTHIIPLFGEYSQNGDLLKEGLIKFYNTKVSPSQYDAILKEFAQLHGTFTYRNIPEKNALGVTINRKVISTFVLKEEFKDMIPIVLMDDYRLMKNEGGNKDKVDKALEVEVDITQELKWYFFIGVIHTNRENTDYKRIESIGKNRYYPDTSVIKDTGNVGERKHFVLTLFNPAAPGFECPTHFGYRVPDDGTYRSLHLVASRDVVFPQHLRTSFEGDIIHFTDYNKIDV